MILKKILSFTLILLLIASVPITISFQKGKQDKSSVRVEKRKTSSGNNYTIFYKDDLMIDVALKRPEKTDPKVLLCIAAAYTDLRTFKADGLFIDKGTVYNRNKINYTLNGAIKIGNGECELFTTSTGKLLTDSLINHLVSRKGSLFQQSNLIENGKGAKFNDAKEFQRRAIAKIKGKTAVIESFEHITMNAFISDLLELGISDALNTDMGSWDEGWYKTNGEIFTIGRIRTQTSRQCNWVIFRNK